MRKQFLVGAMGLVLGLASAAQAAAPEMERVWVKFNSGQRAAADSALRAAGAEFHHRFDGLDAVAVSVPAKALDGLKNNPNIEYIEADVLRFPMAQSVPYGIDMVQARDVWDVNRDGNVDGGAATGANTLVCVIDSGLLTSHEDHSSTNVIGGYPAGWNNDTCGHGTHVAGTINAANNNAGVIGVSPGAASLFIVQVFNGPDCGWSYSSDLVSAANVCASNGAKIISMSLGGTRSSRSERNAFAALESAGVLSIAAAGNDGNTRYSYPASYDSVVSVAAIDANKQVADFSQQTDQVELSAPGVSVLSTVPWTGASFSVGNSDYLVAVMEDSVAASANGALVNGGRCTGSGSWGGRIVLCERGDIAFADKALNAAAGGASGVVIYNNEPGGFGGTLGGVAVSVPVVSLSQEDGQALVAGSLGQNASMSTISVQGSGYEAWDGTSMATPHV
ncbi:MAG: S8 family serine peptidase, partial [Xanthomonadales bacterium]|nr:S8 family serine peptidase [Xanthomonadales bacterium]